ncbi:MalY/PatB family protein [Halarcobacter anaerophilus]|uniref:cysteine-S-conjugate beta-lyase n=1 Tax=Halarcobacter anaerophilus TaxID=877500 RepID=A0A4Q0Y481_9BACT|nr:PatB family C-S lyase [Halarcobacter anaerophilus]QDF28869.1 putative C-S lyase [Halarcobacter anaerophilus]RXJ63509.1 hypothetical protein CRV06_04785 [Halarcobacter anaerophilus]
MLKQSFNREKTNSTKYRNSKGITPLCVADMDFLTSSSLTNKMIKRLKKSTLGYSYVDCNFYSSIQEWMKQNHNWKIQREYILFSQSVLSSLNSTIQILTEINDDILILSPEYHAFYYLIERNQRNVLEYSLEEDKGEYHIDFKKLKNSLTKKTKALLFSSPHNPIGKVWTYEELEKLGKFCLQNNILIFSDEIHSDLVYSQNKHIPIASISSEISNICLTFNSPSKSFNLVGFVLSYIISTNEILLSKVNKQLTLNLYNKVNAINDFMLIEAYKEKKWLQDLKSYLYKNIVITDKLLKKYNSKITFKIPESTYLIWLDFREISLNNTIIEEKLINNCKVRLLNGNDFSSKEGNGFFRMNIALPRKKLIKVLKQIAIEFK